MNGNWEHIERQLSQILDTDIHFSSIQSVGGGCINQAWKVSTDDNQHWFVKSNQKALLHMFEAEFYGLLEMQKADAIRVPTPIHVGVVAQHCYLIMEYIDMGGCSQPCIAGEQLANMHQYQAEQFGWFMDNTIGSTPQRNQQNNDWLEFWRHERLRYQLDLALHKGLDHQIYENGFKLSENLDAFFTDYQPKPALLHGDLWSGNIAYDGNNQPVIFDPATYYGDHEADLAMTELFGGFGQRFYDCYHEHFPIDAGYSTRKILYNLYHILNHYNLFGGGYASQAGSMIERLLSCC